MAIEDLLISLANYMGIPPVIAIIGILLGLVIIIPFFKNSNDIIDGKIGYVLFSSIIGFSISLLVYYSILQIFVTFNVLVFSNTPNTILEHIQIASLAVLLFIIGSSIIQRLVSGKPLIQTKWEIYLFAIFYIILILFTSLSIIIIIGSYTIYFPFLLSYNLFPKLITMLIIYIATIYILLEFFSKRRKRSITIINKLRCPLLMFAIVIFCISAIIGTSLYPTMREGEVSYNSLYFSSSFNSPNITADVSQNFTINNGLLNWFPVFYTNIYDVTLEFDKSANEMSYQKHDNYILIFANKTSKPIIITLNGKRELNSSYAKITGSDDTTDESHRLFKTTIALQDGKIIITINRSIERVENNTIYNYNATVLNEREKDFSGKHIFLEKTRGKCIIDNQRSLYHSLELIPVKDDMNSIFIYIDEENKSITNFIFSVICNQI